MMAWSMRNTATQCRERMPDIHVDEDGLPIDLPWMLRGLCVDAGIHQVIRYPAPLHGTCDFNDFFTSSILPALQAERMIE